MKRTGAFILIVILAIPLSAGVVFEIETKDHEQGGRVYSTEVMVQGKNIKVGIAPSEKGGEDRDMIFRGGADPREMIVVNHADASYSTMDKEAIDAIAGQVSGAMLQMEKALENVSEDKRAMVEQMMKQRMPGQKPQVSKSVLENTGVKETRHGYPCVKYIVRQDGEIVRVLWVTDWSNIDGAKGVGGAFEEMADFFTELLDSMPRFGSQQSFGDTTWEHMKELGGFPVVTRELAEDGLLESETILRSARRQTLDPDAFEPPSGYKRMSMGPVR